MTTGGFPDATVKSFRNSLLSSHNSMRSRFGGARALILHGRLNDDAQAWANHLAAIRANAHGGYYFHSFSAAGQNVGGAYQTVAGVMNAWRNSCGHFYNIVAKGFTHVGFGVSKDKYGGYWWAANFAGNSAPNICNKCPGCSCSGGVCQTSGHAFYSNDPWRP